MQEEKLVADLEVLHPVDHENCVLEGISCMDDTQGTTRTEQGIENSLKMGQQNTITDTGHEEFGKSPPQLPFLGGFRDKRTGACYLHFSQQTDKTPNEVRERIDKNTRETQLFIKRNHHCNTTRETWTQMDRCDLLLDCSRDYTLYPGKYEDFTAFQSNLNKAAIVIQKFGRRWIARRKAKRLRIYAKERSEFFAQQEKQERVEADDCLKQEIRKRKHPRTRADFDVLYKELETWRLQELETIDSHWYGDEDRKVAIQELLQKEIKLLQAIDRMRLVAAKENQEERITKMMFKMSAPKIWELSNGRVVHVRTPSILRASDLMQLYIALAKGFRSVDERMCVLGYVKWTVQEFDCPLNEELLQLIEREADLMYRNRPTNSLLGLRQRILDLFLQFVTTPEFNPEAKPYQYVPLDFDHMSH